MVPFIAAGAFGPSAIRAFGRADTTADPVRVERASTLVTTGVYARTCNPMYVALALLLASWAAWLGQWTPLLGPALFVLYVTRFQILPEERALFALFGEDYARIGTPSAAGSETGVGAARIEGSTGQAFHFDPSRPERVAGTVELGASAAFARGPQFVRSLSFTALRFGRCQSEQGPSFV